MILRPYAIADFDESAVMWGDAVVTRYIGNVPPTREQAWQRVLRHIGHWTAFGFGMFAVRDLDGRWVGEVGMFESRRDMDPPLDCVEAGWVLAPWAHGQGYATEALTAALAHFDRTQGREVICMIDPPNAPSRKVAAKHGFVETRRAPYHGTEVMLFTRAPSRPDRASRASS